MLFWCFVYVFMPRVLLAPYAAGADPQTFAPVADTTVILLRFVAVFSVFDIMNAIFAAGLRGAGDTAFPLVTEIVVGWTIRLLPTYVACVQFGRGLLTAWTLASLVLYQRDRDEGSLSCRKMASPSCDPALNRVIRTIRPMLRSPRPR